MDKEEIVLRGVLFKSEEPPHDGLCLGCVFFDELGYLCHSACAAQPCVPVARYDEKHVIWVRA